MELKPRSNKEMKDQLRQSKVELQILCELKRPPPKTFSTLLNCLRISRQTLSNRLKNLEKRQQIVHRTRNAPYEITASGLAQLEMLVVKPVEEFTIDFVKGDKFAGSIILRVPKRFMEVYDRLYKGEPLEYLRRILWVGFKFWVDRHSEPTTGTGARIGQTLACGEDFNRDGIWDLTIFETPPGGYPWIRKLQTGQIPGKGCGKPLVLLAYDALEEKLKTDHERNRVF